ncbi:peptidyl-prolyl cis-trans isomerase [Aureococcus anophagefferens]|nr:peptidyl-prolyl cis-trans isomerase [Aureococcus anophagefferens]
MFRAAIASLVLLRSSGFVAPAARLSATARAPSRVDGAGVEVTMSGLKFVDDKVGDGEQPEKGSIVRVEYTGWLAASDKFDSSVDAACPR